MTKETGNEGDSPDLITISQLGISEESKEYKGYQETASDAIGDLRVNNILGSFKG